jgi:large subunit ribosomal protein L35
MKMKMKTNKGAAKRLRVLKSGKVKRKGAYGRHIMRAKSAKQKRNIKQTHYVHSANMDNTARLLPNG